MDAPVRPLTIAEEADALARIAVESGEPQANPYEPGSSRHAEFSKRYQVAILRHSAPEGAEGSA